MQSVGRDFQLGYPIMKNFWIAISSLVLSVAGSVYAQQDAVKPEFRVSLSVSPFTEDMFDAGYEFSDGTLTARNTEELQRVFMAHGATEVYARIATQKVLRVDTHDHSLTKGLERARLAAKLGRPVNPELGLFAVYADSSHQPPPDFSEYPEITLPAQWTSLTLEQMLPALRAYGSFVAREILATGAKVNIWDIGNEIEWGFAGVAPQPRPGSGADEGNGPDWYRAPNAVDPELGKMSIVRLEALGEMARIDWLEAHLWPYEAKMLAAVADGVRSVDSGARFSTHLSGYAVARQLEALAFFRAMKRGGFFPDEFGISYYPTAISEPTDQLAALKSLVKSIKDEFDRPVFLAEYGYPALRIPDGPFADWDNEVPDYPMTPEGQAGLLRELTRWGVANGLSGIRPWAADFVIPAWEPIALFHVVGSLATAQPSLGAMAEGLKKQK